MRFFMLSSSSNKPFSRFNFNGIKHEFAVEYTLLSTMILNSVSMIVATVSVFIISNRITFSTIFFRPYKLRG